jgi:hypothetical protein
MPNDKNQFDNDRNRTRESQPGGSDQARQAQQSQGADRRQAGQQQADQRQTGRRHQGSGGAPTRQQQQFDTTGSGQQGGGGADSRFADQIREHQEVVDADGRHLGTVDHIQGDRIKLARSDSSDGQHHYVLLSQVSGIEGDRVRLRERGDNDFGIET